MSITHPSLIDTASFVRAVALDAVCAQLEVSSRPALEVDSWRPCASVIRPSVGEDLHQDV